MERNFLYPRIELAINPSSLATVDMLAPVSYHGEGFIAIGDFPRLDEESGRIDPDDGFHCRIDGGHAAGKPSLKIGIQGKMNLICQRCLQAILFPLDLQKTYVFVKTEEEADHFPLDKEDEEAMVESARFDLLSAIEDEILLALPHAPKHPDGTCQLDQPNAVPEKPNPFKALKNLKK
jgi:uncharacterized protein